MKLPDLKLQIENDSTPSSGEVIKVSWIDRVGLIQKSPKDILKFQINDESLPGAKIVAIRNFNVKVSLPLKRILVHVSSNVFRLIVFEADIYDKSWQHVRFISNYIAQKFKTNLRKRPGLISVDRDAIDPGIIGSELALIKIIREILKATLINNGANLFFEEHEPDCYQATVSEDHAGFFDSDEDSADYDDIAPELLQSFIEDPADDPVEAKELEKLDRELHDPDDDRVTHSPLYRFQPRIIWNRKGVGSLNNFTNGHEFDAALQEQFDYKIIQMILQDFSSGY